MKWKRERGLKGIGWIGIKEGDKTKRKRGEKRRWLWLQSLPRGKKEFRKRNTLHIVWNVKRERSRDYILQTPGTNERMSPASRGEIVHVRVVLYFLLFYIKRARRSGGLPTDVCREEERARIPFSIFMIPLGPRVTHIL